jgi:indoleacetamide hydrolase
MISGQMSAVAVLEALSDGKATAQALNAFIPADLDAMGQATASDARRRSGDIGALEGLMITVKDNIAVDGAPTTGGSPALQDYILAEGTAIVRLRSAGAIFVAKTNLHELAYGITGENSWTGPVRNPFDQTRLAGGSSSGAAVSVATSACDVAIGTDTGGSCRIPAAHCGVVGFRPTTGRYPSDGYLTLSPSRDTLGIMARTVADIARVDTVLADTPPSNESVKLTDARLGVVRFEPTDSGVAVAFDGALDRLRTAGVTLVEIDLSAAVAADDACGFTIAVYETARSFEKLAREAFDMSLSEFSAGIAGADVRRLVGDQAGPNAIPEAAYREAVAQGLPRLKRAFAAVFSEVDTLIYPTTPLTAPHIEPGDTIDVDGTPMPTFPAYSMTTRPDSMAGLPSISLANGLVEGLPTGIQLVGPEGADQCLLAMAEAVEAVLPPRSVPSTSD